MTWAALTLTLTALGAIWTWFAYRRRGLASGMRGLAFTLLPLAAYLTQTLRMFTEIATAIGDWATDLVFNPQVWAGIVVAGLSAMLFVISSRLRSRQLARADGTTPVPTSDAKAVGKADRKKAQPAAGVDDDMAEIEALLRKRGIS